MTYRFGQYDPRSQTCIDACNLLLSVIDSYYDRLLGFAPPAEPLAPTPAPDPQPLLIVPCEHDYPKA